MCLFHRNDAKYFLVLYAIVAYFFSLKMVRRPFLPLPAPPSLRVCVPGAWRLPPPYATPPSPNASLPVRLSRVWVRDAAASSGRGQT